MISGTCACDIEQVPFGVVDLFQIRIISGGFNSRLLWDDLIITGHDGDRAELQTLCQVHCANRDTLDSRLDIVVEHFELQSRIGDCLLGTG